MKKLLWLFALIPALSFAAPPVCVVGDTEITCTSAALTDTVCTLATEGGPLDGKKFCSVWVSSIGATTLSGGGTVDFYLYDPSIGRWGKDNLNSGATVNTVGIRDQVVAQLYVGGPRGRICPVVQGVTVSGGTQVVVTFTCSK